MNVKYSSKNWRGCLPKVSNWANDVSFLAFKEDFFSSEGTCVIPVNGEVLEVKKDNYKHLSEKLISDINKYLSISGIKKITSILQCISGSTICLLVPVVSIEVSSEQKSRQLGLDTATYIKPFKVKKLAIAGTADLDPLAVFDGLCQGLYCFEGFSEREDRVIKFLPNSLYVDESFCSKELVLDRKALVDASVLARFVADAPANWLDSERFAQIAQDMAKEQSITCKVMGAGELEKLGMGSFLSVAQGTDIDPKLIVLEIPGKDNSRWGALIGKGITFDSGGISLKRPQGMDEMKYDLCGGTAVLGAALYLSKRKPDHNVVCIIGAVENMPSYNATRPGDIVKSMSGKTIEVLNTDAEGRLVLCDLLHYAGKNYSPSFMVDVATLTGACLVALGSVGSAVMGNNREFVNKLIKVSKQCGEPLWELPLWPELQKELVSKYADLKNIAGPQVQAGTVTAGWFLREFVGSIPWCHLDIAGTGWNCKATGYPNQGGSAYSLRTLVKLCRS
jgi:leucyl aminopeptidase